MRGNRGIAETSFYVAVILLAFLASLILAGELKLSRPPLFLAYLAGLGAAASLAVSIAYSEKTVEEKALYYLLLGIGAALALYPVIKANDVNRHAS